MDRLRIVARSATLLLAFSAALPALAGCGGNGQEAAKQTQPERSGRADQDVEIVVGSTDVLFGSPAAAQPVVVSDLPGLTVIGSGESRGTPDKVILRLTVGSGNEFSGPGGVADEPIEEDELEPVIAALREAGALAGSISVNTYAPSPYGGFGNTAQITLTWPRPHEIDRAIDVARDVVRARTRFGLQNAETLFTTKNCAGLEEKAWNAALADAQERAGRLAALTGAEVGPVISLSEETGVASPYFESGLQGCRALRDLPPSQFGLSLGEGTPDAVSVSVSLRVTFAFNGK